jgi:hypothetical protein
MRRDKTILAVALMTAGLLLGIVGAYGPATAERASYAWPPSQLPDSTPLTWWYTPLLLQRHVPASMRATIPCTLPPALADAPRPLLVLGTARRPVDTGGLTLSVVGRRLRLGVGSTAYTGIALPSTPTAASCSITLDVHGDRWSLTAPGVERQGRFQTRPVVTGLFTSLDIRQRPAPSVELTTEPWGSTTTTLQRISWLLAVVLALAALAVISLPRGRPRRATGTRVRLRWVVRRLRPVDAVVTAFIGVWWLVGPVLYDDGWVKVRQENYANSGGFSNYYTAFGTELPLDFWVEWAQHWIIAPFDQALVLRMVAIVCLVPIWVLARWATAWVARDAPGSRRAGEWALAAGFLAGSMAWLMTLRPEPPVALLTLVALLGAMRFRSAPSPAPLAIAGIALAFAVTAHPAGLVAAAPLLVISGDILRWTRASGWLPLAVVGGAALTTTIVLATLGADLDDRRRDAALIRTVGDAGASWREELGRYTMLIQPEWGAALRRCFVALIGLAVLGYLTRRRGPRAPTLDLAGLSLALALILLIPTPSKWPWHFGALVGLGAVAIAGEVMRLHAESRAGRTFVAPIALAATVLGIAWAFEPRLPWAYLDLRTLDWRLGIEERVLLWRFAALIPLAVAAVVLGVAVIRRRHRRPFAAGAALIPWLVPAIVFPLASYTITVLVVDALKTPSWTFGRQNAETLIGRSNCGLADDTLVNDPAATQPVDPLPWGDASRLVARQPRPPVAGLAAFGVEEAPFNWVAATRWYPADKDGRRIGFFVRNQREPADGVEVRWGRRTTRGVTVVGGGPIVPPYDRGYGYNVPWLFVNEGLMPHRPPGADALQVVLRRHATLAGPVLSGVVSYHALRLTDVLQAATTRALVEPNVVLYLPCATYPVLSGGIVEPPTIMLNRGTTWLVIDENKTFAGVLDLYPPEQMAVDDSGKRATELTALRFPTEIAGAVLASAQRLRTG